MNSGAVALDIDFYQIESALGMLDPAAWESLDSQEGEPPTDPAGSGWVEAGGSSATMLAEGSLTPFGVAVDADLRLGELFDTDHPMAETPDLVFTASLAGGELEAGAVEFVAEVFPSLGLPGDFNDDGIVNAVDYALWRDNLGGDAAVLNGNGSGAPTVVAADYQLWRSNFGAIASASTQAASVPEPVGFWLVAGAIVAFVCVLAPRSGLSGEAVRTP